MSLAAQAVTMGDDVHMRTQAATNLLIRNLLPHFVSGRAPAAGRGGPLPVRRTICSSSTWPWPPPGR